MCGICVSVLFRKESDSDNFQHFSNSVFKELENKLKNRGPNWFQKTSVAYTESFDLLFCSSVLHLRGASIGKQPSQDDSGNILLWNGEIFGGPLAEIVEESDTKVVAQRLFRAIDVTDVLKIISCFEGPYAFIFYQKNGNLWFGRDVFGRRSMLWKFEEHSFQLCSISCGNTHWSEVPANGIFRLDLNTSANENAFVIYKYLWSSSPSGMPLQEVDRVSHANAVFNIELQMALKNPVKHGLNFKIPSDESSDLFKMVKSFDERDYSPQELLDNFLDLGLLSQTVENFDKVLSEAVKRRVNNQLLLCKNCYLSLLPSGQASECCDHSSTGILFSGGLDSIVIALLVERHLLCKSPIDLINVAFAKSPNIRNFKTNVEFDTPDRITGRNGFNALKNICPHRKWNFIEVNVTEEELKAKRKQFISELLCPSYTVLDDSIGCALWFAARGEGIVSSSDGYFSYASPVRVLFVGMGADEQLAGYSRHKAKFSSSGWNGLVQELSLELDRISSRNLGRDDRIIADNGVEPRYPFLDENVVSFLNSLPVWLKANLNFPRGVGEKLLLRLLAKKYGLSEAAVLPKRAIQFGSRIARIENSKEKGSDVCERL